MGFSVAYFSDGNGDLFSQMFRENYRHFVDMETGTANFTDGEFAAMITLIKDLADGGYISKGVSQSADAEDLISSAMGSSTNRYLFKAKNNFSLIQETYPEQGMMINTSGADSGIETDDVIAGIRSDEAGVIPFTYQQAYGINASSPNKDTAWAFLKFLLSYEVQASPSLSMISLPIHNEARTDKAESLYTMLLAGGGELDGVMQQALKDYIETVELMSDRMNGCTVTDTTIMDMVIQEMAYYFDGTKTADDVCQALQSKVGLYLDE